MKRNKIISVGNIFKFIKIKTKKYKENLHYIYIFSPYMMKGYLTKKGVKKKLINNKYFDTGDLGFYNKKELFINDRHRPIIKRGGELISLTIIEKEILKLDFVKKVKVKGIKDYFAGENLLAYIKVDNKLKNKKNIQDSIFSFLRKRLRPIEVPKKILIVNNF